MAVLLLCSVFDSKVGVFSPPFCCKTRGEAVRSFTDACKDQALPFAKHPEDYRLYVLGSFDDNSGAVSNFDPDPVIGADELG